LKAPVGRYGLAHEWKGTARGAQGVLDHAGLDMEGPVVEAGAGPGATIMTLVRVKHENATGRAVLRHASVLEGLHAHEREADRVGSVAVRVEGVSRKKLRL
jgi:hypothetical protein